MAYVTRIRCGVSGLDSSTPTITLLRFTFNLPTTSKWAGANRARELPFRGIFECYCNYIEHTGRLPSRFHPVSVV